LGSAAYRKRFTGIQRDKSCWEDFMLFVIGNEDDRYIAG
jgi:hypothetical protein